MLKELTEYSNNIKEEMKVTLIEIMNNPDGTNSAGKEAGVQSNDLEHNKEIKHLTRTEKRNKNSKK